MNFCAGHSTAFLCTSLFRVVSSSSQHLQSKHSKAQAYRQQRPQHAPYHPHHDVTTHPNRPSRPRWSSSAYASDNASALQTSHVESPRDSEVPAIHPNTRSNTAHAIHRCADVPRRRSALLGEDEAGGRSSSYLSDYCWCLFAVEDGNCVLAAGCQYRSSRVCYR